MNPRSTRLAPLVAAVAVALLHAAPARALPVSVQYTDLTTCDPLVVPVALHELGDKTGFPPDEEISASDQPTSLTACPSTDTSAGNVLVSMTNLSNTPWIEVWYVSDPETSLSNVDGLVNDEEAFRIDTTGINTPLVSENMVANGIFDPFETWLFVIDDYSNTLGIAPSAFVSPGAVGALSPGIPSSGSIIAVPIPEPSTIALVALSLLPLVCRRRSG